MQSDSFTNLGCTNAKVTFQGVKIMDKKDRRFDYLV